MKICAVFCFDNWSFARATISPAMAWARLVSAMAMPLILRMKREKPLPQEPLAVASQRSEDGGHR